MSKKMAHLLQVMKQLSKTLDVFSKAMNNEEMIYTKGGSIYGSSCRLEFIAKTLANHLQKLQVISGN